MSFFSKFFGNRKFKKEFLSDQLDSSISRRGIEASQTQLRSDIDLFFEAKANLWDAKSNTKGKFPLNMAENNLNWEMMEEKIQKVVSSAPMPDWVSGYTGMRGDESFLDVMAQFLENQLTHVKINPDHLASLAGATAIIELTTWILCDPGDVVVIPAPSYPVYTQDIYNKAKAERYDLVTHHDIEGIEGYHPLTLDHLDQTLIDLRSRGKKFKVLLLTTPDNPTGLIYSQEQLREITDWCIQNEIHLIVNELYGLSLINTNHPTIAEDFRYPIDFQSFATVMSELKSDYLHMIYGLSKDFGMSGFRVGFLHTMNDSFLKAFGNLAAPHLVSNYTQWVLSEVFKDSEFIKNYIAENQRKLSESYALVSKSLKKVRIPFIAPIGSLFVWLDLSEFLSEQSSNSEHELWSSLYNETGVLLTPGQGFGHSKFGQFRLVHPFLQKEVLAEAMNRLETFVTTKRKDN